MSLHIAKQNKNFTIRKNLVLPCTMDDSRTLLEDNVARKIKIIPLSNDAIWII